MLYDNGALLASYAEAALATGDALFRRIAARNRRMAAARNAGSRSGGFYSAYDADSEGHEGKFYVWIARGSAGRADAARVERVQPPLRLRPCAELRRRVASARVRLDRTDRERAADSNPAEVERRVDSARAKLLAIRSKRVWPGLDDKILTSWNALAIRGLAIAARSLGTPEFGAAADRALEFLRANAVARWDGCWPRHKDGVSHLNAYLDDYAYLANALLEMLQIRWRNEDVAWLREILDAMLRALRGPRRRRILLHLRRSRGADPSQQELQRRRDSGRQRHRGARAAARGLSARRDRAGSKRRSARCAPAGWRSIAFRTAT